MIKKRKGFVLIAAIMLIVFVSIVVLGLSTFIVQWYKQIDVRTRESRCIYNAYAGVNYAIWNYRSNPSVLINSPTPIAIDANNNFTVSTVPVGGGGGGAASAVIINATASTRTNSNRRVSNWTIQNNSAATVTIDQVSVTWLKTPKTVTSFVIDSSTKWTGSISTPPAVFLVNIPIPANTTYPTGSNLNQLIFDSSVAGDAGITLTFHMTDGTTTSALQIYPAYTGPLPGGGQGGGGGSVQLTIKSMGKTAGSNQYRSVQATYNTTTGNVSSCNEIFQTVP